MFKPGPVAFFLSAFVCLSAAAQTDSPIVAKETGHPPNMDAVYGALRAALPGTDGVTLKEANLEREGGNFHFTEGNVYFFAPVNGHVTGAVFVGAGQFRLTPRGEAESKALARLTKSELLQQDFTTVVLRFTDDTDKQLRAAGIGAAPPPPGHVAGAARDLASLYRKTLHDNVTLRLLQDVLQPSSVPGGFFLASFHLGGAILGRTALFSVDPESAPDQVELATSSDEGYQVWAAYRMAGPRSGEPVQVRAEQLDIAFDRSGKMTSTAETTLTAGIDNLRVVPLNLYPTLRVSAVFDSNGKALDYVQEDKDADPQFAIILPQPLRRGETLRLQTKYAGNGALRRDGGTMYYLMEDARDNWYPAGGHGLGDFMNFNMTFHVPSGLDIVATGKQVSNTSEPGGVRRIVWATDTAIPVAGFNLGAFKSETGKTPDGFGVTAWANTELPDGLAAVVDRLDLGTMTTTAGLHDELAQGSAAIQIYTNFFGKLPYDHVALTEQSACNYGQSWPMLVYLPICAFWDSTIQHRLGLRDFDLPMFWTEVTPHEVAHQWWGQLVGFDNYRDQWMSEGFAEFSAGVYLLYTRKTMDDYREFWKEQHDRLLKKNENGLRPIDVGPLTMGYRVNNEKTGNWNAQYLLYSKGAYILHMLEMLYWTPRDQEEPFKRSMQEFVQQYSGRSASTADFEASIEKTMPKWLDLDHNGKLDWFFNEYVYGTELPRYDVASDFTANPDGTTTMHFKVTQSKVSQQFKMLVPFYLQMQNGNTVRIANLTLQGNDVIEKTVNIGKLPSSPKRALVNYNADVLSE